MFADLLSDADETAIYFENYFSRWFHYLTI